MQNQLCPGTVGHYSSFPSAGPGERMLEDIQFVLAIQVIPCTLFLTLFLTFPSPPPPALYTSPECSSRDAYTQGRKNHNASGKSRDRNGNTSFFQGGTAVHGTSTCAVCLGCHKHKYTKCTESKLLNGEEVCM